MTLDMNSQTTDTPRTDAWRISILNAYDNRYQAFDEMANMCRKVERELAAAEARYTQSNLGRWQGRAIKAEERADNLAVECQAAIYERDERRAEVERLRGEKESVWQECERLTTRNNELQAEIGRLRSLMSAYSTPMPPNNIDTEKLEKIRTSSGRE